MAKEGMKMDKMQDKKLIKKAFGMHDKQEHKGEKTDMSALKKGGMAVKKMATGGMAMVEKDGKKVPAFAADGVGKMKKGGKAGMHMMPNGKMMKDSDMPKMAKGGCGKMAKGGGIEVRGKTKGRMC